MVESCHIRAHNCQAVVTAYHTNLKDRVRTSMIADERRKRLTELVARRGFMSLVELARSLDASESTIRRDLDLLDSTGQLRRTHGGAISASDSIAVPAFEDRSRVSSDEKRQIGVAAARLVGDGETVLLDGGTTTYEVARHLCGRSVQVVTNSLPVAYLLAGDRRIDLTLVGGYVYPRTGVAVGQLAINFLGAIHAKRLIMSVAGVTERGFFNSNALLVETQLRMIAAVDEVVVVADHSKFGQQSLAFLCELGRIQKVVSDSGLAESHCRMVREAGLDLIVAESGEAVT